LGTFWAATSAVSVRLSWEGVLCGEAALFVVVSYNQLCFGVRVPSGPFHDPLPALGKAGLWFAFLVTSFDEPRRSRVAED